MAREEIVNVISDDRELWRNNISIMIRENGKNNDFSEYLDKVGMPHLTMRLPTNDDEVSGILPIGSDEVAIQLSAISFAGLKFPLPPLVLELCEYFNIFPIQLSLDSYRILNCIPILNNRLGNRLGKLLGLSGVLACYDLVHPDGRFNAYLRARPDFDLVTGFPDNNKYNLDTVIVGGGWYHEDRPCRFLRSLGRVPPLSDIQYEPLGEPCAQAIEFVINWWGESGENALARETASLLNITYYSPPRANEVVLPYRSWRPRDERDVRKGNISSFGFIIKASCKTGEFGVAREIFNIALESFGHKEPIYSLMLTELLAHGEPSEAKAVFEASLESCLDISDFPYKDLVEGLCKDDHVEDASELLNKLITKGYGFDPAVFIPVIDGLREKGCKHEADEIAERMMEMTSEGNLGNKIYKYSRKLNRLKPRKYSEDDSQTIVHRDDDSSMALKTLKRVQKGWGHGITLSLQPRTTDFVDYWDGSR